MSEYEDQIKTIAKEYVGNVLRAEELANKVRDALEEQRKQSVFTGNLEGKLKECVGRNVSERAIHVQIGPTDRVVLIRWKETGPTVEVLTII